MGKQDEDAGVIVVLGKQNPFKHLKTNYKQFEARFKKWVVKHSLTDTIASTLCAVSTGALYYTIDSDGVCPVPLGSPLARLPMLPIVLGGAGGRLERARNMAVLMGVNTGTRLFMKYVTREVNFQTGFVAGFTGGIMVSLVCGINSTNAITNGVLFGLCHGGVAEVQGKLSQPGREQEQVFYKNTRGMLSSLGLDHYEKKFKKGLLTDKTLPYLNDSDLQEVKIPVEARRLILDHIQRENVAKKEGSRTEI